MFSSYQLMVGRFAVSTAYSHGTQEYANLRQERP